MVNEYPKEGKITNPDDVGKRRMPTKVAGEVLKFPNPAPVDITKDYGYEEADPDAFAKAHRSGKVKVLHPKRDN